MALTSSVFIGAVVVMLGCLIGIGVIVWQAFRSVKVGDQLWLPLTAEDWIALDDAVLKNRAIARAMTREKRDR